MLGGLERTLNAIVITLRKLQRHLEMRDSTRTTRQKLYEVAVRTLGKDASPLDLVNDDLGCAESVSTLLSKIMAFSIITGTYTMLERLSKDSRFVRVYEPVMAGTIILSPTGTGNGKIIGHVGIVGLNGKVYSNNSATGLWDDYYTIETWKQRYSDTGGLSLYFFAPI